MIKYYNSIHFKRIGTNMLFHLFGNKEFEVSVPYQLLNTGNRSDSQLIQMSELSIWKVFSETSYFLVRKNDEWIVLRGYVVDCLKNHTIPDREEFRKELKKYRDEKSEAQTEMITKIASEIGEKTPPYVFTTTQFDIKIDFEKIAVGALK